MQAKVNVVLLGTLLLLWGSTQLAEPAAALDPHSPDTAELAALEDAFASDRADVSTARALADQYLNLGRPRMATAALSSADPSVRRDPAVLHRLAKAYEESGRMEDALATARLARARCARALGTRHSSSVTPVPERACSERTYAALDMHVGALAHMARWGVNDVQNDARARRAYILAVRSARILSASAH